MPRVTVVAQYRDEPSEGIQVISKTLVDGLRSRGVAVRVVEPSSLIRSLPMMFRSTVVFTHGPGRGVVIASWVLRHVFRATIIWVSTRPDLASTPKLFRSRSTAHFVVANRQRDDLDEVARGATFVKCFIGIDPTRVDNEVDGVDPWPELSATGRPIAIHLGHLRRNRGLEALAATRALLGDSIEIVVQGSPTFEPDAEVVSELVAAGVVVRRNFESDLRRLFTAADLYVFPVREEDSGAIELPLGVLEAVASGTPVVTTRFGVLPEALEGVAGIHFADPEEIPEKIKELLESNGLRVCPDALPERLHAKQTLEAVYRLVNS